MDIIKSSFGSIVTALGSIIAAVITGYLGYLAVVKNKVNNKFKNKELKYHPIHHRMNDFKEYINYEINACSLGRETLVKDFLLNMINVYQSKFKKLAEEVDNKDLTDDELKELNLRILHEAINERSTYFYNEDYSKTEREALKLLVKKYQAKMSKRIEYFKEDIRKVVDSNYYNEQVTMQALIFDKYIGELSHIMTWFEDIIDEINGAFTGLEFKGKKLNLIDEKDSKERW